MNVSPVNNNTFKGTVIINNLRRNAAIKVTTNKEMDKQLTDKFQQVVCKGMTELKSPEDCLSLIKNYVKSVAAITGTKLVSLKYPSADAISVIHSSSKDKSHFDVPGYFAITHYLK